MVGQIYQKQKGFGTSDQSLFRLTNRFRKFPPSLVIYYLTKFDEIRTVINSTPNADISKRHENRFFLIKLKLFHI